MAISRDDVVRFLQQQRYGIVASVAAGAPQAAVVGVATTDELEIVFDTLDATRKVRNLRADPRAAVVIGWDDEVTVQIDGVADFPEGGELERIRDAYFAAWPDGRERLAWPGLVHARVKPTWLRYSDFRASPPIIVELDGDALRAPSLGSSAASRAESPASAPVRTARAADAAAATSLLAAQLGEHGVDLEAARLRAAVDGLIARPERGAVLVAELEGAVVGVACLAFIWTLEHGGASAWLDELYVTPAHRGRGLGEALLAAAIAHARERGHAAIDLEIEAGHERVESLYRREGFTRHTRTRWVKRLGATSA
jgi:GNAT superfamily N-acetyltransferase